MESKLIDVVCTFCGVKFKRFLSRTINPKTGLPRKIIKCEKCKNVSPKILFWEKVDKETSKNGCWIWTGALHPDGYGIFLNSKIKERRAHRVSWHFTKGKIPKGKMVLHNCPNAHNRACVNPDHLYLGNQSQNTLDQVAQGTHHFSKTAGEKHHNSILTEENVLEIRRDYRRGNVKNLASKFDVSVATIRDVAKKRSWNHI